MIDSTGSLSVRHRSSYYTLQIPGQGWLAAEMVQYLDEVLESATPDAALLKLMGFTMRILPRRPRRRRRVHWVEVDLQGRVLETNSELIRKAVKGQEPEPHEPYSALSMRRIHEVLDRYDFTVKLH